MATAKKTTTTKAAPAKKATTVKPAAKATAAPVVEEPKPQPIARPIFNQQQQPQSTILKATDEQRANMQAGNGLGAITKPAPSVKKVSATTADKIGAAKDTTVKTQPVGAMTPLPQNQAVNTLPVGQMAPLAPPINQVVAPAVQPQPVYRSATNTSGTNIGRMERIGAAQVAPIERVQGQQLGAEVNRFSPNQAALVTALEQQAAGQGPSLAQLQYNKALDQNIAAQQAIAASANAGNRALASRAAAYNTAALNQGAGRDASILRMAEQMQAREQLGNVLNQGRVADISQATEEARLQQEAVLANQTQANAAGTNQALLTQRSLEANQAEQNKRLIEQAQINSGVKQTKMSSDANLSAARSQAGAANYRAQLETALGAQQLEEQKRANDLDFAAALAAQNTAQRGQDRDMWGNLITGGLNAAATGAAAYLGRPQ